VGNLLVIQAALGSAACVLHSRVANLDPSLGPASFQADGVKILLSHCYSGDRGYFLGVDLFGETEGTVLRVLVDPLGGPRLRLVRHGTSEVFEGPDCQELRASVEPTGWRVNHVRDVRGSLEAACTNSSGSTFDARISFAHCH
jgi:hypothetical protein